MLCRRLRSTHCCASGSAVCRIPIPLPTAPQAIAISFPSGRSNYLLSSNGGQVEGMVLNAVRQPATGAAVVLAPDAPRRAQPQLYKEVSTDQYGRFVIKGIAPGGYKLFAWEDVESGAYQDPEFLIVPQEWRGRVASQQSESPW